MQSIRKQLVGNYVAVALFTVLLLESMLVVVLTQYYLGGVERTLFSHAETAANFFNRYADQGDIYKKSNYIFENLDSEEAALVEVLDLNGRVIVDSTGAVSDEVVNTGDFIQALRGRTESWTGRSELDEPIIAVSAPIYDDNVVVGVLRYVSSLSPAYRVITRYIAATALFCAAVVAMAYILGRLMARRILMPIQELVRVTNEVTQGNYKVTAIKYQNDEIGRLADAVNLMTREITRSEQAKNEFISSISHELRTPLTSIKGWVETLQETEDDPELLQEGFAIIRSETDRLIILVNDLLDFSKLAAHRLTLNKEVFAVERLLADVHRQFAVRCRKERIRMTVYTDKQEGWLYADYNRLKQVFINVVDNAMKFTAGRPRAEIKISSQVLDDQIVMIVEDNGSGISPEELERVKEKFYKGSSNKSGTGLGLSIASEIMELHGGKMLIDSVYGQGTKVVLCMPCYYDTQPEEAEEP